MKEFRIDHNWGKEIINGWIDGKHSFFKVIEGMGDFPANRIEAERVAEEWLNS